MDGFVTKPANAERLASAIDAVLPARATESDDVGTTPALNESVLRALAADIGEDGVAEVVTLFLAEAPAMLDRLARSSISGGRLLLREVHTLASAARNVGLLRVGAVAAATEASLGTVEPKQECLLALQGLLRDGIARLAEWHERTHGAARLDADQCADGVTACSILAEHCA
jgi:HPt (histidine-containing phosphotransfer) domain-containing protein